MRTRAGRLAGLLATILAFICCDSESRIETGVVELQLKEQITRTCSRDTPCVVQPADVTPFSWNKLIVFDFSVEPGTISNVIGKEFSAATPFYSRKWFFIQDDKIVHFEEEPLPEVDQVMKKGDVAFEISGSTESFASFDLNAKFVVKRIDGVNGEAYLLTCVNCQ